MELSGSMVLADARRYSLERTYMGLEIRSTRAATDDDRHGTIPIDHIINFVPYKFQLSTANPCGSYALVANMDY